MKPIGLPDRVSQTGNSDAGEFIYSLNFADINSTWVESHEGQAGVLDVIKQFKQGVPFKLLGINSDNGSDSSTIKGCQPLLFAHPADFLARAAVIVSLPQHFHHACALRPFARVQLKGRRK